MDMDLHLIKIKSSIYLEYFKVKSSREDWIEKSWPHRTDVIESMKRSELSLLEIYECFIWMDKEMRLQRSRCFDLELHLQIQIAEVNRLKQQNKDLLERVEL
jgi:hypothetical protein